MPLFWGLLYGLCLSLTLMCLMNSFIWHPNVSSEIVFPSIILCWIRYRENKYTQTVQYVAVVQMKDAPVRREYSSRSERMAASDSLLPCRLYRTESCKPQSTTWYPSSQETVGGLVLERQQHTGNSCTSAPVQCWSCVWCCHIEAPTFS